MAQSRMGSFIETLTNTAIGWGINLTANLIVLPLFGFNVTIHQAIGIGVIFTVISVIRSYLVRRAFNTAIMRKIFDRA